MHEISTMVSTGPVQHATVAHLYRCVLRMIKPMSGAETVMAIELGKRWAPASERGCSNTISYIPLRQLVR
jgi:hypothetical protein